MFGRASAGGATQTRLHSFNEQYRVSVRQEEMREWSRFDEQCYYSILCCGARDAWSPPKLGLKVIRAS